MLEPVKLQMFRLNSENSTINQNRKQILAERRSSFYSQDSKPGKNVPTESVMLQRIYFNTTSQHMAELLSMYLNIRAAQHLSNGRSVRNEVTSWKASATKNANLSSQLIAVIPPPLPGDCVPWQQSAESGNRQPLSPKRKHLHHPSLPPFTHQPLSEITFTPRLEVESHPLLPPTSPFVYVYVTLTWSLFSVCLRVLPKCHLQATDCSDLLHRDHSHLYLFQTLAGYWSICQLLHHHHHHHHQHVFHFFPLLSHSVLDTAAHKMTTMGCGTIYWLHKTARLIMCLDN